MDDIMKFSQNVTQELTALKELDVAIPARAFERAADLAGMTEYAGSMSVSDCADLLIQLA